MDGTKRFPAWSPNFRSNEQPDSLQSVCLMGCHVFRRFDTDKDGVLTIAEFKNALSKYGFHLPIAPPRVHSSMGCLFALKANGKWGEIHKGYFVIHGTRFKIGQNMSGVVFLSTHKDPAIILLMTNVHVCCCSLFF